MFVPKKAKTPPVLATNELDMAASSMFNLRKPGGGGDQPICISVEECLYSFQKSKEGTRDRSSVDETQRREFSKTTLYYEYFIILYEDI